LKLFLSFLSHLFICLLFSITRLELDLNNVVLDVPGLHLSDELLHLYDQLMKVSLIQPVPVIFILQEGVLDAYKVLISALSHPLTLFLNDSSLGNVIDDVAIDCLSDDVAEKSEDKGLIGDLIAFAHILSILLKLFHDNLLHV
jgi:hypothetical protein